MNKPIGVFDSGVGGLTVVKELMRQLPHEDIIYFGDTARLPYGIKSKETVRRFSIENTLFLSRQNVKLIVVACNTSSSLALPFLKNNFNLPLVGVISPAVEQAIRVTKNKRIGIIGTKATIRSDAYKKEINRLDKSAKVFSQTCPLFVPFVEEGLVNDKVAFEIALRYLSSLKKARIDTLILGCTHYPLLKTLLKKVMGSTVVLIDSAQQVAKEVKQILELKNLTNTKKKKAKYKFFVSDEAEYFLKIAQRFLNRPLRNVRKVNNV